MNIGVEMKRWPSRGGEMCKLVIEWNIRLLRYIFAGGVSLKIT